VPTTTTQFMTSGVPAGLVPAILNTNPPDGATNVPTNVAVAIKTNAVIDLTTVTAGTFRLRDNTINQDVLGVYSLSPDGTTVFFLPSAQLATGRTYTININSVATGLSDVVGKQVCCPTTLTFTTGVGPSAAGPHVSAISPANGLTQVPTNARIAIQFDQPVDVQTTGQVSLGSSLGAVPLIVSLSNANQTLNLVPTVTLRPNTQHTVSVSGVTDLSGVSVMTPMSTTFTTGPTVDFSAPQVSVVTPANGATGVSTQVAIQIQFNKSINPLTMTSSTFTLSIGGNAIAGTIVVGADGRTATFTPSSPLGPGATYTIRVTGGVLDLGGQSVVPFQSTFTAS
jgi:hypothetical protein